MRNPRSKSIRYTSWAVIALETGVVLFIAGLTILYLNPFWHFDEGGFLDWRVHWWNAAGQILTAAGMLVEALALVGSLAVIVSRCSKERSWPYPVAVLLVLCVVIWVSPAGFIRDLVVRFEWNKADGFSLFRLEDRDGATGTMRVTGNSFLRSMVEVQLRPLLQNYFKLNDWKKMNGDIDIHLARIVPVAWPVALGSAYESFDDPDQTPLMRAAAQEDLKAVQEILSTVSRADVNALDQGGQTALILACEKPKADPAVIKALLAAGADVNVRGHNGYAALTWALANNNKEIARVLIRSGARR